MSDPVPPVRPWRAALIGCGRVGSELADDPLMQGDVFTHAEAYVRSPKTELVAVLDADEERARRCGERWGVRAQTRLDALLESTPEIVSICTPTPTHFEVGRAVLEHGKGVRAILCEKPLAESLKEAESLVALAHDKGVMLAVVYMRRYAKNLRTLRRFLREGGIGVVQAVSGWYPYGTLHSGTHWFDMLRMLVGEIAWVEALDVLREGGGDPTLDILLGLESGALVSLRALDVRPFVVFEMDIFGTGGRVRVVDNGFRIEFFRPAPSSRTSGLVELQCAQADFGDRHNLMLHAVDDLADALTTGRAPLCTAEDGLSALRIGLAAFESARLGKRIRLATGAA